MRVHELADELGVESADVIEAANEAGIEVTAPMSGLSDDEVATVKGLERWTSPPDDALEKGDDGPPDDEPEKGDDGPPDDEWRSPPEHQDTPESEDAPRRKLVGRGSVTVPASALPDGYDVPIKVTKQETITVETYGALPERVRAFFTADEGE